MQAPIRKISGPFRGGLLLTAAILALAYLPGDLLIAQPPAAPENPGEVPLKAIETVQRSRGVFVYRYSENMGDINPLKDFVEARRIIDSQVIGELKGLLTENAEYSPQFTARCLPSWDYGLEFRESPEKRTTFLFSFRCNQMMIFEDRVYRDFSPQSVKFYALLKYELNERTTRGWRPEKQ
ncbi:MAG: hypothetical protein NXI24_15570 [bacterium]|nr:hypothetical protein [bacterium]